MNLSKFKIILLTLFITSCATFNNVDSRVIELTKLKAMTISADAAFAAFYQAAHENALAQTLAGDGSILTYKKTMAPIKELQVTLLNLIRAINAAIVTADAQLKAGDKSDVCAPIRILIKDAVHVIQALGLPMVMP